MLRELAVQNLALIEDVRVELQPGFCAWTGETGAGKTLLLEALGLLLGERGSSDLLRTGAEELRITGRFEIADPELRQEIEHLLGGSIDEGEVILSRRLNQAGRSYAYANEQPVAVNTLRQLGSLLVDIHGQHESHSLLQPAYQLQLLDAFGNLEPVRENYLTLADQVRDLRRRHALLIAERQQRLRELALLRFERDELDQANLRPGELAELLRERETPVARPGPPGIRGRRLFSPLRRGWLCGRTTRQGAAGSAFVDGHRSVLTEPSRRLEGLVSEVQDLAETLRSLVAHWEADPGRLEEVEQRSQALRRLEKKYAKPVEELITYRVCLDEQETRLQQQEEDLAGIEQELAQQFASSAKPPGS